MVDVISLLKEKSGIVDRELQKYLPSLEQANSAEERELCEMMWDYFKRGGKRMRPALCMLSCELFGEREEKAYPTAVALEMFQNFVLIHDDIEDASELRRGKPALHKIYGIEKAVNAGDALFLKMYETLYANKKLLGSSKTLKAWNEFNNLVGQTVLGQAIELNWIFGSKWDMSERDYLEFIEHKTAWYTGATPLRLGAIVAGAKARDLSALKKVGLLFGKAFQIQDDLLNLVGKEFAKTRVAAEDLLEGKRTLMLIHLLKHCSRQEKEFVMAAMDKKRGEKIPREMEEILELMKKQGSIEYGEKIARGLAEKARHLFNKEFAHLHESQAKQEIEAIIDFVVKREL